MSFFGLFPGSSTIECCSNRDQGMNHNPSAEQLGEIPSPNKMKQLIIDSQYNNNNTLFSDQKQGQEQYLDEMANEREEQSLQQVQNKDGLIEIAPVFKVPKLGSDSGSKNDLEEDFSSEQEEEISGSLGHSNSPYSQGSFSQYSSSLRKQVISKYVSIPIKVATKKNYDDRLYGAHSGNNQAESAGENENSNSNSNTPRQNTTYKASIRSRNSSQHSLEGGSHSSKQHKRNAKAWTEEEDRLLRFYYSKHNGKWPAIANEMADRNSAQCSQRWRRIKPSKIRRPWTPEEDVIVMQLINQHGKNWGLISSNMDNRSGKQVRERYINKLDPSLNNDQFTEEEDKNIINKYYKIGPKWSEIAKYLHGRSENMVKNRFYSFIKKTYAISSLQGGLSDTGSQCESGFSSSRVQNQEDKSSSYASSNYNDLEPSVGSGNIESEDSSSENEYQQMSLGPNLNNPSFVPQADLNNINNNNINKQQQQQQQQQQFPNIINYANNNYDLSLQGFNSMQQQNQQVQDPYSKKTNSWGKIEKADEMFHTPRLALANNSSFFPTEMFFQQQKIQEEVLNGQQQQQQQQQQQIQQSQQQQQQQTPIETNNAFFQANPSPLLLLSPAQLKTDQFSFTSNTPNRRFLLSNSNTPYQQHSTYPNPSTNNSLNANPLSSFAFNTAGSNNPNSNNNHFNFNNIASTPGNKTSNPTNAFNQINQQFNQQQQQQLAAFNSYQNQQQQQQQQQQQPLDQNGVMFRFPNTSNSNCTTPQQNGLNLKTIEEPFENLSLNSNVQGGQFYVQPMQTAQPFLNDYQQQIYQQSTAQSSQPFQSNDFQNTFPQQYSQQQQANMQYAQPQGRGINSQTNNTNTNNNSSNNNSNNNAVQFILNSSTNQFNNQIYSNSNNNFFNNQTNNFSNSNNPNNAVTNSLNNNNNYNNNNNSSSNNSSNNNSYQIINAQSKADQGTLNPREDLRIDISCARKQDDPPPLASTTPKINRKQLKTLIVDLETKLQLLKAKQQDFNDEDSDC